jgi:hypothetical protein
MFGTNLKRVFTSRWKALWWSLGVLFTAWQMTPAPDDTNQAPVASANAHHVNPWAKDPAPDAK